MLLRVKGARTIIMKWFTCILLVVFASVLASCDHTNNNHVNNVPIPSPSIQSQTTEHNEEREHLLHRFIIAQLTGDNGIYTNYQDTEQQELVATGHEILSESMGLAMRYYTRTGQESQFEQAWKLTERQFNMESGFSYRFSPKHNKLYTVNAAVDDLRIIRALYEAADRFEQNNYREQAERLGKRFLNYNSKEDRLFDFYDDYYKMTNSFITLCYIDLRTLQLIADETALIENMLQLVQNGYLSDEFPFYETRYLYEEAAYQSEDINTVESLLTILSLVEVGKQQARSIDYIKTQVEQGTLYGRYSRDGKPLTDIQSTAIYAITAIIGSELRDEKLYRDSIERMEQFQVLEQDSELYGAYGDIASRQAYSFDNLHALLAYSY